MAHPAYIRPAVRSGELLVRRGLIESGLRLMMSRSLVRRELHVQGFLYGAEDSAASFLDNMNSPYIAALRNRPTGLRPRSTN